MPRNLHPEALELIKENEGLRLKAYLCPAGVWTIGWGHTGPDVHPALAITEPQAQRLFDKDIEKFAAGVERYLATPANDNQFSALVSLAFNIGMGAFATSTCLKRHNKGDFQGAAQALTWFDKMTDPRTGKLVVSPGLKRRRAEEQALYLMPANDEMQPIFEMPQAAEEVRPVSDHVETGKKVATGAAGAAGGLEMVSQLRDSGVLEILPYLKTASMYVKWGAAALVVVAAAAAGYGLYVLIRNAVRKRAAANA